MILAYWDGTAWSREGITVLGCDPNNHMVTVQLAHLSEFAFFAAAPTALLPVEEPAAAARLYLPIIGP